MSSLMNCTRGICAKYTFLPAFNNRWFCVSLSLPNPNKQAIQRRWQRMTERYLNKTANMISSAENNHKSRKTHLAQPIHMSYLPMGSTAGMMPNAGCQRRARQLSVVFYDYITSLLSNGEVCPDLNQFCFEVVSVKVVSDMSAINVSWAATGGPGDDIITALLPRCASELRSKLMDLRIMGNLPPIQFIKDLTASRLRQVEELLSKADMGPDFDPTSLGDSLTVEPTLLTDTFRHSATKSHELEGYSYKQGPGGSVEVAAAAEDKLHGSRLETAVDDSKHYFKSPNPSGDETKTIKRCEGVHKLDHLENIPLLSSKMASTSCVENVECLPKGNSFSNIAPSRFRSDVYGLDHADLYQQVLHIKRRAEDRSYVRQPAEAVSQLHRSVASNIKKKQVANKLMLTANQNNTKRPFRELNRLLSSQFHIYSDS